MYEKTAVAPDILVLLFYIPSYAHELLRLD
jgi:hypothetical protein